jgi:hypothetical protein
MIHQIYIVGDRVRMRHLAPYASNTSGTVTWSSTQPPTIMT